jgi:glycosyltransferase involved in cell wall biosynthesis
MPVARSCRRSLSISAPRMHGKKIAVHYSVRASFCVGENVCMMSRNRRIAIVCQPWDNVAPQSRGSLAIISYELARRLVGQSHVIIYGQRGPGQNKSEMDGASIEFKRFKVLQIPQGLIEILLGILSCHFKKRINYMFSYLYHPFYALRVALNIRTSKCDIVLVYNFLQFATIIKLVNPSAKICLSMQCEWLTQFAALAGERRLRKIDLIIGCSDYITEGIRTRFPAIAIRCHTVYNGVDTDRFCPTEDSKSQTDETERLLFVGRLSPEKGVHVLIRAFRILAESRPRLRLDLVGASNALHYLYLSLDPQDRANATLEPFFGVGLCDMVWRQLVLRDRSYLADLAFEVAGDDRIISHGAVLQTDTIHFYRRAAALVFPSVWNEPAGLPTFEAQACGTPVVSTYSGGIPEYVLHGQTGILVARGEAEELATAISRVLDNPALARAMGEAGRQRAVERFSWDVVSRRLADLLESASPAQGSQNGKLKAVAQVVTPLKR